MRRPALLRPAALCAALLAAPLLALPCATDWDCALNGVCAAGACACDRPWIDGVSGACAHLDMLPAPISACGPACAYHGNTTDLDGRPVNSSTWGARVLRAADGGYRMAVNEYAFGCGLNQWRSNSQIAWTRAESPLGPFAKLGVAVSPWATNPTVFVAPDGALVIVTCGGGFECAIGASFDAFSCLDKLIRQPVVNLCERRHRLDELVQSFVPLA